VTCGERPGRPAVFREVKPSFAARAAQEIKAWPFLKAAGIPAFIAVFFAAYFAVINYPQFAVTWVSATPVDRWIPFQPWTVPIYCSLWIYVSLPAALTGSLPALLRLLVASTGLALLGLIVFWLVPTAIHTEGGGFLKTVDQGRNACPSLHAAFAFFTAGCLGPIFRRLEVPRWMHEVNWAWCGLIVLSTLTAKQHMLTDLVAGAPLGAGAAWWHNRR